MIAWGDRRFDELEMYASCSFRFDMFRKALRFWTQTVVGVTPYFVSMT